jgi:oligosaccharyltransferase complex subunit alpha (ribophorin I)
MKQGISNNFTCFTRLTLPNSQAYLLNVRLPVSLGKDETAKVVVETIQTHATHPWPEAAGQDDDQALKYETSLFVISPYHTSSQRTKIR